MASKTTKKSAPAKKAETEALVSPGGKEQKKDEAGKERSGQSARTGDADFSAGTKSVTTGKTSIATGAPRAAGEKPLASPAVRQRARDAGVDLRQVHGTGPAGRIGHDDLDAFIARGPQAAAASGLARKDGVEDIKVVGLRRRIAEKMALAKSRIPHITYVEEVDVTALEDLRAKLNGEKRTERPKLTLLPFLMRAMVKAVGEQPGLNATFDDDAGIIHRHAAVHIGIAAQTPGGLMVPVVRHAEARDLFDCAAEAARLVRPAALDTASGVESAPGEKDTAKVRAFIAAAKSVAP